MRLKIFFFPFALVLSLIVSILYIQPEISRATTLFGEKTILDQKESDIKTQSENIAPLSQALSKNASLEKSVLNQYFPQKPESEVIVDTLNLLANQSGIALTAIDPQKLSDPAPEAAVVTPQNQASSSLDPSFANGGGAAMPEEVIPPVTVRILTVKISGKGAYPNIKDFLHKVAYTNRFNNFGEVMIGKDMSADAKAADALTVNATIDFPFLAEVKHYKNASATNAGAVFASQTLNLKPVQHLNDFLAQGASVVPKMVPMESTGRSNPFSK